ncbi:hypothetical protein [Aliikangiella maris]|uniref:EexN family lipoprotein n=2 Tax=Aliikangiella maris TaxID=3162458 RepID=A0ABV2BSC9_9GAMM
MKNNCINIFRCSIVLSVLTVVSACTKNAYQSHIKYQSLDDCYRISEIIDRNRCIERTNESYEAMRARQDKIEQQEKARSEIDLNPKKDESIETEQ